MKSMGHDTSENFDENSLPFQDLPFSPWGVGMPLKSPRHEMLGAIESGESPEEAAIRANVINLVELIPMLNEDDGACLLPLVMANLDQLSKYNPRLVCEMLGASTFESNGLAKYNLLSLFSEINAIVYYFPRICKRAGVETSEHKDSLRLILKKRLSSDMTKLEGFFEFFSGNIFGGKHVMEALDISSELASLDPDLFVEIFELTGEKAFLMRAAIDSVRNNMCKLVTSLSACSMADSGGQKRDKVIPFAKKHLSNPSTAALVRHSAHLLSNELGSDHHESSQQSVHDYLDSIAKVARRFMSDNEIGNVSFQHVHGQNAHTHLQLGANRTWLLEAVRKLVKFLCASHGSTPKRLVVKSDVVDIKSLNDTVCFSFDISSFVSVRDAYSQFVDIGTSDPSSLGISNDSGGETVTVSSTGKRPVVQQKFKDEYLTEIVKIVSAIGGTLTVQKVQGALSKERGHTIVTISLPVPE